MTTSANIASVPGPFVVGGRGRRLWPYGDSRMYKVDEIKPRKKKKRENPSYGQVGMLYVSTREQVEEAYTEPVGRPEDGMWKIPSLGKIGVWRTVKGRRYFFPVDGSGPTPKIPGEKKKGASGKNLYASPKKKKKGLLSKIMGLIGGGGGASASAKDVKPKTSKGGGGSSDKGESPKKSGGIPGGSDMLDKTDEMLLKASRSKGGKSMVGPLKKMQSALKDDDPRAFKKAEASLAKATSKLAKKRG